MKTLMSIQPGGPETLLLQEVPSPTPGMGDLRVRVLACGINYPDVLVIEDKYQFKPPRPFSPGGEIAGVVEAVGEGVTGWKIGDRLIAVMHYGGLSEQALIPAASAVRLPDGKNALEGAALIFTYGTTLYALRDRGALRPGETLLVLGAAGGVGLAAIEIGKAMGARVVAGVSTKEKAVAAKSAGADEAFVYERGPFEKEGKKALAQAIKQAVGPQGAHVVYDPVGGAYTEAAVRCLTWEGRYLVIGFTAGIPNLPLNLALLKSIDIRGVIWGAFVAREPDRNAEHMRQLLWWWEEGKIRPRIDRVFELEEGGRAIARLAERSAIGKIVVRVSGSP